MKNEYIKKRKRDSVNETSRFDLYFSGYLETDQLFFKNQEKITDIIFW